MMECNHEARMDKDTGQNPNIVAENDKISVMTGVK